MASERSKRRDFLACIFITKFSDCYSDLRTWSVGIQPGPTNQVAVTTTSCD